MKKALPYIMLHAIVLIYSLGTVCSKTAASKEFLSFEWFLFYGLQLFALAVYSLVWQQVLKSLPLNVAYANKAVTVIWGMVWGILIFGETISVKNLIGSAIVLAGVILMVNGEKGEKGEKKTEAVNNE